MGGRVGKTRGGEGGMCGCAARQAQVHVLLGVRKKGILAGMGCSGSERGGKAQARQGCRFEEGGCLFRNGQQGGVL